MEDESVALFRGRVPSAWVVREYRPDYGIDLSVEVFQPLPNNKFGIAETTGEHLFVQMKSMQAEPRFELRLHDRANVEKEYSSAGEPAGVVPVIRYVIDTPELQTVQAMGAGVPVMLVLALLDTKELFWVCMNDYIDKVLLPTNSNYYTQDTCTLYIPVANQLLPDGSGAERIRTYAARGKLYSAFAKFHYQSAELSHAIEAARASDWSLLTCMKVVSLAQHFSEVLDSLDVWVACDFWPGLRQVEEELIKLRPLLNDPVLDYHLATRISGIWRQLEGLGRTYEEVTREWSLPTPLGRLL